MKKVILAILILISINGFSQLWTGDTSKSIIDAGIGISKMRNGYLLYTDILGVPYINQDEKYQYSPLYSVRGKIADGPFKYRFFLDFAADKVNNIVHDTSAYEFTTSFNFSGLYPKVGFERMIWSKWVELKMGVDFMYMYQLYDLHSYAKGMIIPNLPLEMDGISKHVTKAWGVSPFITFGLLIKKHFFLSVEAGKYYAYGTTNSKYNCNSLNLNNNHALTIDETGKPTAFYKFDENNFFRLSIDYRFYKKTY